MSPVLVPRRDPLGGLGRHEYLLRLRDTLQGRVTAAWVFGSLARGERPNDVDLMLVTQTDAPFVERARAFWDVQDLACPTDILVYTPAEMATLEANPPPGFWTEAIAQRIRVI